MRSAAIFLGAILLGSLGLQARAVYRGKVVRHLPNHPEEIGALPKAGALPGHFWPHPTGQRPLLALLVDFSDAPADFPLAAVDSFLNAPGYKRFGNRGSVRDFYLDISKGKLDLHYTVKGYYRAKKTKAYYEKVGNSMGGDELMTEAVKAMDSTIDYKQFGSPGDTRINSVALLYAGAEHDGDLWGTTTDLDVKLDGRPLGRAYWARIGKSSMQMTTLCHEMGHMLFNWPDLYIAPQPDGLGPHCLMGAYASELIPVPPSEPLRADQGWIDVSDLTSASNGVFQAEDNERVFRLVNPARNDESFFVVNRKNVGRWETLGGRGLLIFHFDMAWNETSDETKEAIHLVPDLGSVKPPNDWPEAAWYFYRQNQSEFSVKTHPDADKWHDGKSTGIRLYDISAVADTMTFAMGTSQVSLLRSMPGVSARAADPARTRGYDALGALRGSAMARLLFARP